MDERGKPIDKDLYEDMIDSYRGRSGFFVALGASMGDKKHPDNEGRVLLNRITRSCPGMRGYDPIHITDELLSSLQNDGEVDHDAFIDELTEAGLVMHMYALRGRERSSEEEIENKYRVKPSVWFVEKEEEIIADLNSANAEFNIVFDKWLTEFLNEFSMPHCMKALMQHDDLRKNAGGLVETVKRVRTALIAAINLGFEAGFTSDIRNSYSRRGVNATLERWSLEDLVSLVEELRAATVEAVSKMNGELDEAKSTIENKEVECGALKSSRDKFRLAFLALLASMIPAGVITGSIGVGATYAYMTYGQEAPLLEEAPEVEVGE